MNEDATLMKNFNIRERKYVQLRLEAYSVTNSPQWGTPNTSFGGTSFGQITSAGGAGRASRCEVLLLNDAGRAPTPGQCNTGSPTAPTVHTLGRPAMRSAIGSGWPVHADQLIFHFRRGCNSRMNPARLPGEVQVKRAKDDSSMIFGALPMKP